ncbi:hypothetical protein CLAIMM_08901 [Cladophialophora immunda]|nr:hypothetical protein CLAIMM_08901 [Cladophialophora immunda]
MRAGKPVAGSLPINVDARSPFAFVLFPPPTQPLSIDVCFLAQAGAEKDRQTPPQLCHKDSSTCSCQLQGLSSLVSKSGVTEHSVDTLGPQTDNNAVGRAPIKQWKNIADEMHGRIAASGCRKSR